MQTARRICAVLSILALTLGMLNATAYARGMAGGMLPDAGYSTAKGDCPDCFLQRGAAACAETACALFAALPSEAAQMPAAGLRRPSSSGVPHRSGLIPYPDIGPPRTILHG